MTMKQVKADLAASMPEVEVVGEKPLHWYDVASIGSGEMIAALIWGWIAYIGYLYGIEWSFYGFVAGVAVIASAWWLYREMISAIPEPGMLQSYAREAGIFSLGTAYFILYVPLYAGFMWLELGVATGVAESIIPGVPHWAWPLLILIPIVMVNLSGHQITGKLQAALVAIILVGDVVVGAAIWMNYDSAVVAQNLHGTETMTFWTFFAMVGMWMGIMAGILEVQQVVVDEWADFEKSRDKGLIFGSLQMSLTQAILGFGVMVVFPLDKLLEMPVPPVGVVDALFGKGLLYVCILLFIAASVFTTVNVYFMAMGRILALYSMQGALPRIFARFSGRAVPWFSILFCFVLALVGTYWTDWEFIVHVLSAWSTTLYLVVAVIYLVLKRNQALERPIVAKFGIPIGCFVLAMGALMTIALLKVDTVAVLTWIGLVALVIVYDQIVVPRTKRGSHYRQEVLRRRESAVRLG